MIKHFGRPRPKCALSWDDRYPQSYNYVKSNIITNLRKKAMIVCGEQR